MSRTSSFLHGKSWLLLTFGIFISPQSSRRSPSAVGPTEMTTFCCSRLNDDSQDPVCEEFHDEFMMSRWHEPTVMVTRTSVLQDTYPQGPHNERARGVRHEDVASLVPACSGARVCQEQRQRRLHWFRGPVNQTVRNWSRSARRPRGTRSEMQ